MINKNLIKVGRISQRVRLGALLNLDSDVQTFLSGLTTPLSTTDKQRINTLVVSIKSGLGISLLSERSDKFRIPCATAEASLRNLAKDAHHATAVNSPSFTAYEGFTGDGITSYIDENYNPSSDGSSFTLNDASYGLYVRSNSDGAFSELGARVSSVNSATYPLLRLGDASNNKINQDSVSTVAFVNTDSAGHYVISRYDESNVSAFKNGTLKTSATIASTAIANLNWYSLAVNNNGSPGLMSARQLSAVYAFDSLTLEEVNIITNAFEVYMQSYGKGVI